MKHLPMERNVTLLITRYDAKEVKRLFQQLEMTGRSDVRVRLMTQSLKARTQKLLQFFRYGVKSRFDYGIKTSIDVIKVRLFLFSSLH
jgi:hypothetical protein